VIFHESPETTARKYVCVQGTIQKCAGKAAKAVQQFRAGITDSLSTPLLGAASSHIFVGYFKTGQERLK
jgi:hypothetical protein